MATIKPLINFLKGWPNPGLLPSAAIQSAATKALSDPQTSIKGLSYAPDEGYPPLRNQLARWLTNFYKPPKSIASSRIIITGGASQGLANILQVYSDPLYTRNIWMVSPTYFLACRIFEDAGFAGRLRAVPEDDEGIDVKYLEQEIRGSSERAKEKGGSDHLVRLQSLGRDISTHCSYMVLPETQKSSCGK